MAHGIQVSWSEVTNGCTFNLYRSTTTGGEGVTPYQTGISASPFVDTTGTPGQQYFYTVTAVLAGIESGQSAEVSATFPTIPITPNQVTAVAV